MSKTRVRSRSRTKPLTPLRYRKRRTFSRCEQAKVETEFTWTPDFFGPVFKHDKISLREALQTLHDKKRTRMLASFAPDELIYALELTVKNFREFGAVLLLIDMSAFNGVWNKFSCAENNGSHGFSSLMNVCISFLVANIYSFEGDIVQISAEEILVMWKVRKIEHIAKTIDTVIGRALHFKYFMTELGTSGKPIGKVKMVISSGPVIFSVIGNESGRNFVLVGNAVADAQSAKETCSPGDVVVTESAWGHVSPEHYEYVLHDAYTVKIVETLGHSFKSYGVSGTVLSLPNEKCPATLQRMSTLDQNMSDKELLPALKKNSKRKPMVAPGGLEKKIFTGRFSLAEATRKKLGTHLKNFVIKPVLQQIEKDVPLEHLTETRRVTVVVVDLDPFGSSVYEVLTSIDECYILLNRVICNYSGCLNALGIHDGAIHFVMVFGLIPDDRDHCKNGLVSAAEGIEALKRSVPGIGNIAVGISTGMAYCGVIGHSARMNYVVFGAPLEKANKIALLSSGKIYCDHDTIIYSCLPRETFRSCGMKELKSFGRCQIYEFIHEIPSSEVSKKLASLDYVYPILGRAEELDIFTDILDDIGASERTYCGFLIEGPGGIGKSRLLDELARVVESRQIFAVKLSLDETSAEKSYSTIHDLLIRLFEAEGSNTIEERERVLIRKLSNLVPSNDFCYMNIVWRVTFPFSANYYSENEETRLAKSIKIFDTIVCSLQKPHCIMLDDVQFVDSASWKFVSRVINSKKVVLAMTTRISECHGHCPQSNIPIASDKRIFSHRVEGLEADHLSALVCQFLNVRAISVKLDNILRSRSGNDPGWCEAFVTLMLQNETLRLASLTPCEESHHELVYPHPGLITKIPKDLSPEDTTPEVPWFRGKTYTMVCLIGERFIEDVDALLNSGEIDREIYHRSNKFERKLLRLTATLGSVFTMRAIENVMKDHHSRDTSRAVFRMKYLRIFECAFLQRRDFQVDDPTLWTSNKRSTFSNMHHIFPCTYSHTESIFDGPIERRSHCKLLEFKRKDFRKFIIAKTSRARRKNYNSKIVELYERSARKCDACGGGVFLRTPGHEKPARRASRPISIDQSANFDIKKRNAPYRDRVKSGGQFDETEIRRISIVPAEIDSDEESMSSLEMEGVAICVHKLSGINSNDACMGSSKKFLMSRIFEENDPSRNFHLRKFGHIDYRNCQCVRIVDCLFWKIFRHLENLGLSETHITFMMNYGTALIQTGQSFQATELLTAVDEKLQLSEDCSNVEWMERQTDKRQTIRGTFFLVLGDAFANLGDYVKAKKYYELTIHEFVNSSDITEKLCVPYRIIDQACTNTFHRMYPDLFVNRITGPEVPMKISAALGLSRLPSILLRADQNSLAKLFALRSFNEAFVCSESFLEKCDIYLRIVQIFRELDDLRFVRSLEKAMVYTIRGKSSWSDVDEVKISAIVFKSIFEIRMVRAEYEDALHIGIKVLKITTALKMSRTKLAILPQLIQLTMRLKRIYETVDLMRELYYLAAEDIDASSTTWYYALSLDLAIDAGMILESFETCVRHAEKIGSNSAVCVARDPDSLRRLLTCIWLWQLRMSLPPTFARNAIFCTTNVRADNFSHVLTVAKVFECHLLTLARSIDMKKADEVVRLLHDIKSILATLENVSKTALFIRPRFYLLKGYLEIVRSHKATAMRYLKRAAKLAIYQSNAMLLAWISQNERTWEQKQYNNMINYWVEHVGFNDAYDWQRIHCFNTETWSFTLYPIPLPDTHLC